MQNITNDIDLSESDYGFVITRNERIHLSEKCIYAKSGFEWGEKKSYAGDRDTGGKKKN